MTPVDVLDVVEVEQILESVEVLGPVDGEGGAGAGERGLHQDVLHTAVHLEADGVVEVVGGGPHQVAPLLRVSEQEETSTQSVWKRGARQCIYLSIVSAALRPISRFMWMKGSEEEEREAVVTRSAENRNLELGEGV